MEEGWCIWLTGLPGSGKSTIAKALKMELEKKEIIVQIVSSDELRKIISSNPKYTEDERNVVYGIIVYIAKLLTKIGINVLIDATGNLRRYRDQAKQIISKYKEVYLQCPLDVCIERESKRIDTSQAPRGIYRRALSGKTTVPGMGAPYDEPVKPDLRIDTSKLGLKQIVELIIINIIDQ